MVVDFSSDVDLVQVDFPATPDGQVSILNLLDEAGGFQGSGDFVGSAHTFVGGTVSFRWSDFFGEPQPKIRSAEFNQSISGTAPDNVIIDNLMVEFFPIPEPSTALLLGFGLLGLTVVGRRQPSLASLASKPVLGE